MIIKTAFLGDLEINEDTILTFAEGIPGFEASKRYVMIPMGDATPFNYLQSMDEPELCLLIAEPFVFFPEYEFDVPDEELQKLDLNSENKELAIYTVVTVPEDFKRATANLLAPLVINISNKKAMQYVPGKSVYTTRHLLFRGESNQDAQAGEVR